MRHWAGHCLFGTLFALVLLTAPAARAQLGAGSAPVEVVIDIEQAPGSEACPDKEAVFRSMRHLFPEREFRQGSEASESTARARINIRPLSPGHEAVLTLLSPRRGERVIREKDEDCRGLADALALAFVMLVAPPESSTESVGASDASSPPATTANPDSPAATVPKPAELQKSAPAPERVSTLAPTARSFRAGVGASLIGGLGVLSEPALGVAGEIELAHRNGWGLSVQGLRLWAQPAEGEGGSVKLTLWGLLFGPCYGQRVTATARLDGCLRFGIGSQHADAQGFLSAQSGNFPWQVLVPSLSYRQGLLGELLSGFVRVGFVTQLRPQSFSVQRADSGENVQIASAPRFGVMADVGLMFGSGLF